MDRVNIGGNPLKKILITFWKGFSTEINLDTALNANVNVKGITYEKPLRFLEIYGNLSDQANSLNPKLEISRFLDSPDFFYKYFMPRIPGVNFAVDENTPQPPFSWKDCNPQTLLCNFNYNTNAVYRILRNLTAEGKLKESDIESLLDQVCLLLSAIYRANNYLVIRNLNNNLNMYLISKAVEFVLGKGIYDSERQEFDVTCKALLASLSVTNEQISLSVFDKMGYAIGKGVSFIEKGISEGRELRSVIMGARETSSRYFGSKLAIDHRSILLDMIENEGLREGSFELVAIFDDATETVDDLLWLQDLLVQYNFLTLHILVNTAQISINFCSEMMSPILSSPVFASLAALLDSRFRVSTTYCPFISYQLTYLPPAARAEIEKADTVFIKGANFFETLQIKNKPVFHAFVVSGPVSRLYTGLEESDAVFAFVPDGREGYIHSRDPGRIVTLKDIVALQ